MQILNINTYINRAGKNNRVKSLSIHGNGVCKIFLDWIYKNSTIHLQRKYDKYLKTIDNIPPHYDACIVCGGKYYCKSYCHKCHYKFIGKKRRHERFILLGK